MKFRGDMNEAEKQGETRESSSPQSRLFEKKDKTDGGAQGRAQVPANRRPWRGGAQGAEGLPEVQRTGRSAALCSSQENEQGSAVPGTPVGFFHVEVAADAGEASPSGMVDGSLAGGGRGGH